MTKKQCDKCGKIFLPTQHESGSIDINVYDSNHMSWPDGYIYDLCPKCMYKIEKLILAEIKK